MVATNALELGIDIGSLDAVVMAGYPGTIASTWQRAGRAGRRQTASLAVLVASSAPLDQYIIEHPEYFFDRPPEHAHINPDNLEILLNHLKCAAFELPLRDGETFGPHDTIGTLSIPRRLEAAASCAGGPAPGAWHWTSDSYPADAVNLRSISSDNFVVVDITGDHQVIAEVAFTAALTTLHEKAIYLHEARQYQVERFDYEGRKAYVRRVDSDYFTDAIDYTQVKELEEFESSPVNGRKRHTESPPEPPDRRVQEDQVLHDGEHRRGKSLHAGAGDAHHRVLAAFPSGVPGQVRGSDAGGAAGRPGRAFRAAANGRRAARHVRSARSWAFPSPKTSPGRRPSSRICTFTTITREASDKARRCSAWHRGSRRSVEDSAPHAPAIPAVPAASAPSAKWASEGRKSRCGFSGELTAKIVRE